MDASRQSKRISANVSGFLGTERITLNDNLLSRCSPQAIMAVMGHEMGHYVLNHLYKLVTFFAIEAVVFFAVLRWGLAWSLTRWGEQWQIRDTGDPAVLPLAVLILSVLSFVFTPINNTLVRTQEYEADIFGLNSSARKRAHRPHTRVAKIKIYLGFEGVLLMEVSVTPCRNMILCVYLTRCREV